MNHTFNVNRFFLLLKKDLLQGYKTLLITIGAVTGATVFLLFISSSGEGGAKVHMGFFLPILWLGGLILTSMVFKEAHSIHTIHGWLMTPASRLEKFLQKLMFTTVLFILALLGAFFAATALNSLIYRLFLNRRPPLFNPFQSWVWINIGHYLIVQSMFFLGAVWFRKYNFVKTVLTLNILQAGMALFLGLAAGLVYWTPLREAAHGNHQFFMEASHLLTMKFNGINPLLITVGKVIYFGCFAPVFWFVSWLRMKEIEITDGV